ncbi:hypothetical protein NHX12_009807 [Muraenolepis orangiensis]|uniref:Bcr-Abl oncoprotein oligomerisation domain-containing protein n=1 Tax=Muraenolepis orangiensis TaxID=630683 RepID=A0A9Q0I7S9_9TELE|nr:hypothetical protein NHX12_009807 [Muraenolepis orangiensis]
MWDQEEFEKHWRNEFPDGDAPRMRLHSAEDVEAELERCKATLRGLQRALSEERFKVIYLQTTVARHKRGERFEHRKDEDNNFNADSGSAKPEEEEKGTLFRGGVGPPVSVRPERFEHRKDEDNNFNADSGSAKPEEEEKGTLFRGGVGPPVSVRPDKGAGYPPPVPRGPSRGIGQAGRPIPVPPRTSSMPKGNPTLTVVCQVDGNHCEKLKPTITTTDHREASDHEYEDLELNENFVRSNLVGHKGAETDSRRRTDSLRDALRPIRPSRDLDSGDDGRLSPSLMQVPCRTSRGSGCSTPDRRSDGYLSSDHDDSSSAGMLSTFYSVAPVRQ